MKEYYYFNEFTDPVYEINELLPKIKLISKSKQPKYYLEYPMAFDIESTTIGVPIKGTDKLRYTGFMYHWQYAITCDPLHHKYLVIMGRRWEEYQKFINILINAYSLNSKKLAVTYVHSLAYEFQFIRNFFEISDMFARQKRVPLKFTMNNAIEFRCSYLLTNMSLKKSIENTPTAIYNKLSGDDYDYTKIRTPDTKMSSKEIQYCVEDVRGLLDVINYRLREDTITSIPLTSTGYVRRKVRSKVLSNPNNQKEMKRIALDPHQYSFCKEAFRGGNSGVNPYLCNQILENVDGDDIKSSYPAIIAGLKFPITPFKLGRPDISTVESYIDHPMLIMITFLEINMKNRITIPYISKSKCLQIEGKVSENTLTISNGRVVKAKSVTMCITDIDYKIISTHYKYKAVEVHEVQISDYGFLNTELRMSIIDMFKEKTLLERGDKYLYSKKKNEFNANFGMMVTDICKPEILYTTVWDKEKNIDIEYMLSKYYNNRNSFLSYQHGVWVTAHARYRLQEGIDICEEDIVMSDTDSCYYILDHKKDFERLNEKWLSYIDGLDIPLSIKIWEEPSILGIWEHNDKIYSEYITLGAKKHAYAYWKGGEYKYGVTVAGLSKNKGAEWLKENGDLMCFQVGKTIPEEYSGRTVSFYNDVNEPYQMTVDGCTFTNGSNIGVTNATYTIGVSDDYLHYLIQLSDERYNYYDIEEKEISSNIIMEENEYA